MRKKTFLVFSLFTLIQVIFCSSCATITNGTITPQQRTKPAQGQPRRQIKTLPLLADVFLLGAIPTIIDFANCSIYKKDTTQSNLKH